MIVSWYTPSSNIFFDRLDGNPYCANANSDCSITQSSVPSSTPPSECTNECSTDYAVNPRASSGCECAHPVIVTCTFYATKVPILTDFKIIDLEKYFITELRESRYIASLQLEDTQAVINIISTNQMDLSVFPPNSTSFWSPTEAAILSYVLQNHDVEFPQIGPLSCGSKGNPYTSSRTHFS